jgi:hypothetical protein
MSTHCTSASPPRGITPILAGVSSSQRNGNGCTSRSNTTGRSKNSTCSREIAKSCIITARGIVIGSLRTSAPDASTT